VARRLLRAAEPLAAALLGTWLVAFVVATVRVRGFAVSSSDFQDYCFATLTFQNRDWPLWPSQRTVLAGALPGLLAPSFGIFGALVHASLLSTVGLMAVLYAWGRTVGGRAAGWLAVVWAPCLAPLVLLSRTVSFYPEVALVLAFGAASVAGLIARGTWPWLVATAIAMYLLPLSDLRSVTLVVALLPCAVLGGLLARVPWWARPLTAALPVLTTWLAWRYGGWAFAGNPSSLQFAVQRYAEDAGRLANVRWELPTLSRESEFWWGQGSPTRVVEALEYLRAVDASRPPALTRHAARVGGATELYALRVPGAFLALVACVGLVRRPRRLLALVLTVPPFLALLRSAALTLPHPRQLALGSLPLPVVAGVGTAALLGAGLWGLARLGRRWPRLAHPAVAPALATLTVAAIAVLNAGWLGGPYAPDVAWRRVLNADEEPRASLEEAAAGETTTQQHLCSRPLREDARRGHSLAVPWFPSAAGDPPRSPPPNP
jgi:hypothetical protein